MQHGPGGDVWQITCCAGLGWQQLHTYEQDGVLA